MNQIRPLIAYGFTIFLNAAISFFTFSFITNHLTTVDYGTIHLYNSFLFFLIPFISAGVPFVININYFNKNGDDFKKSFTHGIVILIFTCLLFTLFSLLLHRSLSNIIKVNFFFVFIAPLTCFLLILNEIILNLFRNKGMYIQYAAYSIFKNLVEVGLTILLIMSLGWNWTGRLGSSLMALTLCGLISLFFIFRWRLIKPVFDKKLITLILVTGFPFIPERLAIFILSYSDRFFIDYFGNTADVGFYGTGAQLAVIVNLSILTLNNTFQPELFKTLSLKQIPDKKVRKIVLTFIGLSALVTLGVIILIPFIFDNFIGAKFQPGKIYAFYLCFGLFFWAIYNVFVAFLLCIKKNKVIMSISIIGMFVSILFNLLLIPYYGALGAAYTSMAVYACMAGITIYYVNRYFNLNQMLFKSFSN